MDIFSVGEAKHLSRYNSYLGLGKYEVPRYLGILPLSRRYPAKAALPSLLFMHGLTPFSPIPTYTGETSTVR